MVTRQAIETIGHDESYRSPGLEPVNPARFWLAALEPIVAMIVMFGSLFGILKFLPVTAYWFAVPMWIFVVYRYFTLGTGAVFAKVWVVLTILTLGMSTAMCLFAAGTVGLRLGWSGGDWPKVEFGKADYVLCGFGFAVSCLTIRAALFWPFLNAHLKTA